MSMTYGSSKGENMHEELVALRRALADIGANIAVRISDEQIEDTDACMIFSQLQELKREISLTFSEAEQALAERIGNRIITLPNGALAERKQGGDRKSWDHKSLANDVADRLIQSSVDMDTGEMMLEPKNLMVRMLDFAAPSYWRVSELSKIGLTVDRYCEKSEGKMTIVIKEGKL